MSQTIHPSLRRAAGDKDRTRPSNRPVQARNQELYDLLQRAVRRRDHDFLTNLAYVIGHYLNFGGKFARAAKGSDLEVIYISKHQYKYIIGLFFSSAASWPCGGKLLQTNWMRKKKQR